MILVFLKTWRLTLKLDIDHTCLQRSQKIESLIKRVVEKESRERFRAHHGHRVTGRGTSGAGAAQLPPPPSQPASSAAASAHQNSLATAKLFQQQQQQRLQVCDGIVR